MIVIANINDQSIGVDADVFISILCVFQSSVPLLELQPYSH